MKPELKPCPFCGGDASFDHDDNGWNWIHCKSCDATTNARVSAMDDCKPLLAETWNRRALEPKEWSCTHKWGFEFSTHNHEPAKTVCVKCGYKPDTHALNTACEPVKVPSDDEIEELAKQHLWAHAQFVGAGKVYYEGEVEFARAILAKYGNQSLSDTWKGAVEHELSALHLTTADFNSPSEAIKALIQWGINVATDPTVNGGFKLVPVKPTHKQICLMALEIQGINDKGVCRTDDPRWPDSVAKAEAAYKAGVEASPEPEKK